MSNTYTLSTFALVGNTVAGPVVLREVHNRATGEHFRNILLAEGFPAETLWVATPGTVALRTFTIVD
jgi:hypothetical protein